LQRTVLKRDRLPLRPYVDDQLHRTLDVALWRWLIGKRPHALNEGVLLLLLPARERSRSDTPSAALDIQRTTRVPGKVAQIQCVYGALH